jgi:predicted MFS family arabinose efflux permease
MATTQSRFKRGGNRQLIGLGLAARIAVDTTTQLFYAFLPIIAAGIGVTPLVMGRLISIRSIAGLFAPLAGAVTERSGYRPILRATLIIAAVGLIIVAFSRQAAMAAVGMVFVGAGLFSFVPLLQAFASERLSAENRARGMGIIEYGFAISSLAGIFLVGQLIDAFTWRTPLFVMAVALIGTGLSFGLLPPSAKQPRNPTSLRTLFDITENRRGVWIAIVITSLVIFGAIHTFSAYSTWLFLEYGFGARELSFLALAFGVIDISGSGLVSLRLDRIGRKRALIIGSIIGVVAYLLLPIMATLTLPLALVCLLCCRFAFEFSMVSSIIIASEAAPTQRARAMTLSAAVVTAVLALAGLTGTQAYASWGLIGLSMPSAIAFGLVGLIAWREMDGR